jgi:cell fate regulator YaaT (PSP1 superfamily)
MDELRGRVSKQVKESRKLVEEHRLAMKIVDVEPILGEELLTFFFISEDRIDFRKLVTDLASKYSTRIEMRQVGSRDESRLVADYEKCGQHCCCKEFLKNLSPVSMRTAKQQKQTLDPKKISGRCGRLMCCLRYEDQTYRELKKNLPHKKTRVGTPEGPGIVLDGKILTQLVLVELEHDKRRVAIPIEELSDPETCPRPWEVQETVEEKKPKRSRRGNRNRKKKTRQNKKGSAKISDDKPKKNRNRRRRRKRKRSGESDKD